ncbi:MAG: 3-hydroxyacyl-CoA dehydrogenase family protein [Terriglobia bacterium]
MREIAPEKTRVGLVGLGLMGTSIATCLLSAGHPVTALELDASRRRSARRIVRSLLAASRKEEILKSDPSSVARQLAIVQDYQPFESCQLVIESATEDLHIKREIIHNLEDVLSSRAIIGTNTSGLPVTDVQRGARHPERILGIHWAEPAHITRFMEIICGGQTAIRFARRVLTLARGWGKEPSLLRKDIRGFITNRVFYAMLREAFYLVESGYATVEDVDRSLRNDLGYWITFAGPFRFLDLTGIPAYGTVMKGLFPELNCGKSVPELMKKVVASGGRGVSNAKGFYRYTPRQALRWEQRFLKFSYEIRRLAQKYPDDSVARAVSKQSARSGRAAPGRPFRSTVTVTGGKG